MKGMTNEMRLIPADEAEACEVSVVASLVRTGMVQISFLSILDIRRSSSPGARGVIVKTRGVNNPRLPHQVKAVIL